MIRQFLKKTFIGQAKSPYDKKVFHNLSLVAFFAWVGLGADGLSSSCYGPEEAFLALGAHPYLSLFVALASAITVIVISASYIQIIEQFPHGGGGYMVASKLLSPGLGMFSGCALLIDYVLTIAISVAAGSDALFSFMPIDWQGYKLYFALFTLFALIILNLRGVKESVLPLVPVFMVFVLTHIFVIVYAIWTHIPEMPQLVADTGKDINSATAELGFWGVMAVIMRAYSMGAGTYTGIEAVSNGMSILREPKAATGRRTMQYMALSLAVTVMGLMLAYLLYHVQHVPGKTLNAVLFQAVTMDWDPFWGQGFVWTILIAEALILFVAAQAGFIGGPGVLANMALDRWLPTRFAMLSDRLVTQNGVMLMGIAAVITLILTGGSVKLLVVLYSINVFIDFCLAQAGMVRYWWRNKDRMPRWVGKICINGVGLALTTFILISVLVLKFHEGGWVTLVITASLVGVCIFIKNHYLDTAKMLKRLNPLMQSVTATLGDKPAGKNPYEIASDAKVAVVLVNGFNGLGLHTLFNVVKYFGREFKGFMFVEVGVVDAGNFKGIDEVERLNAKVKEDMDRYVAYMRSEGFWAEGITSVGTDAIAQVEELAGQIIVRYPSAIFFGGQLVFGQETFLTRLLHNNTIFAMQSRFYPKGIPFVILPIRV